MLMQTTWWGLLARRRRRPPPEVLPAAEFRRRLKKERLRADRARASFSLLALRPPADEEYGRALGTLARRVAQRIRFSDDVGMLSDGRLGVFLPDTPAAGAWKVAQDVMATYDDQLSQPDCEVYVYPFGPLWPDDDETSGDGDRREPAAQGLLESAAFVATNSHYGASLNGGSHNGSLGNGSAARTASSAVALAEAPPAYASKPASAPVMSAEQLLVSGLPWWKCTIDLLGAAGLCLVLSPLLVLVTFAIKLTSRGPVLFAQERDGLGGRPFRMFKFRTMRVGADAQKHALRQHSEQDGPAFKMKNDPRLTLVGRVLRATSIDELPQLWNVLRGEMSLVGPRPLPCDESAGCRRWQRRRLEVTPGLTCIWQVSGRNLVAFDEWMRMDLRYVDSRSPGLDFKLLVKTLPAVLSRKGAM